MSPAATVRPPAVAGAFYPADPAQLRRMVTRFLEEAVPPPRPFHVPYAVVAPHAGYVYSGPIAGSAYAPFAARARDIDTVILVGASHHFPYRGIAASSMEAFRTPLGLVPVDRELTEQACEHRSVGYLDEAHAPEHSLEVQLPFLQMLLPEFLIVPLLCGATSYQEIAEVMDLLWEDRRDHSIVVVSSDLSHYLDYDSARRLDRSTAEAIEDLDPERISEEQACGRIPIGGLLLLARRHGLKVQTVDLRNSGDTAGPRSEVVGYGAFLFHD